MKIGIFGGTVNPPHLGHVTSARAVIEILKLDRLLLVPDGTPPHKTLPEGSPTAEQRLEMSRLAGEQMNLGDRVETLNLEIRRAGRSFTADTLETVHEQYPDAELWLLMGTDMAAAKALDDKKGQEISAIEITDLTTIADYFVIATGTSNTQINALCGAVEKALDELDEHEEVGHGAGLRPA